MIFKMQDGRQYTDYTPSCSLNAFLQNKYKTSNSHEYRYYLQHNADNIHNDFMSCAINNVNNTVVCPVCSQAVTWKPQANGQSF